MVVIPSNIILRLDAEKARRSLYAFVKKYWHIVEPGTPFVDNWHVEAICNHLEAVTAGDIIRLLVNMPPRMLKSTIISVMWPAWEWATKPHTRWLFSSYASALSIRDSVKCRRLIEHAEYQRDFGEGFNLVKDQNQKVRFENDKTGYRLATSVDGGTTGEGGDKIVCDDPHNVKEAYSDTIRAGTITWWREAMSTRGNDPKTAAKVIVMQRVHADDLSAYVLSEGGWQHLNLPNEFEEKSRIVTSIGWTDPRTKDGELLNPRRIGPEELAAVKKELGSLAYAGQFQQRPVPASGGFFKLSWWGYYGDKAGKFKLPSSFDMLMSSWDCTFKDVPESDYVVGLVIGYKAPYYYLLEEVRGQFDYPTTKREIKLQAARYPGLHAILIEDKANGPAVISELKGKFGRIVAVNPEGGKMSRAAAASPVVESGEFLLPHPDMGLPWVKPFQDEAGGFPLYTYDDRVDAMTQAIIWHRAKLGKRIVTVSDLKQAAGR